MGRYVCGVRARYMYEENQGVEERGEKCKGVCIHTYIWSSFVTSPVVLGAGWLTRGSNFTYRLSLDKVLGSAFSFEEMPSR